MKNFGQYLNCFLIITEYERAYLICVIILSGVLNCKGRLYMNRYIIKRILQIIPILFCVSIISFFLNYMVSGDSALEIAMNKYSEPTKEQIEKVRIEYGLDETLLIQYLKWGQKTIRGDLGFSYKSGRPVFKELIEKVPLTFKLSVMGLIILIIISLTLGILSGLYPYSILNKIIKIFSFISVSTPQFFIGLFLLYFFGVKFRIISVLRMDINDNLLIPAITLTFPYLGTMIRLMKIEIQEVMTEPFILTLKANGISSLTIILKHALRNAILPIVTKSGSIFANFLCGSAIIEKIFSIPGIGNYSLSAISCKDMPVVQGYLLFIAVIIVIVNLIVDVLYSKINPRIKVS